MASFIAHFSVLALYWLFPGRFSLMGLAIGCYITDFDGLPRLVKSLRESRAIAASRRKRVDWRYSFLNEWFSISDLPFHNLGAILFLLPASTLLTLWLEPLIGMRTNLGAIMLSVLIGLLSHFILDLPAHSFIRYLTPFEKPKPTPFVMFRNLRLFKRWYPFLEIEREMGKSPYSALPYINYLIVSTALPFLAAGLVLAVRH